MRIEISLYIYIQQSEKELRACHLQKYVVSTIGWVSSYIGFSLKAELPSLLPEDSINIEYCNFKLRGLSQWLRVLRI